jgi:hypothetical protein
MCVPKVAGHLDAPCQALLFPYSRFMFRRQRAHPFFTFLLLRNQKPLPTVLTRKSNNELILILRPETLDEAGAEQSAPALRHYRPYSGKFFPICSNHGAAPDATVEDILLVETTFAQTCV